MRNKEDVVRGVAAGVAMASTVPYLTLKTAWLCGSEVGVHDPAAMDKLWLLNLITFGMDVIALALALTFVRPWGRRVRAGLVAFPMWVATGLLGTILVALPVSLVAGLVLGPEHQNAAQQTADGLAGWVFVLVYGGFSVQGVALILAFVLYARRRWAGLLRDRIGDLPDSPTLVTQRVFASVAALFDLGAAVVRAYWAAGGAAGLPQQMVEERSRSIATMDAVSAVMAVAAAGALLVLVFRVGPGRRLRTPLAVVWTAAGSTFAWGSWQLVAFGSTTSVPDLPHAVPGLMVLVEAGQVVAGLLVLAVGAVALTERTAASAGRPLPAVESRA